MYITAGKTQDKEKSERTQGYSRRSCRLQSQGPSSSCVAHRSREGRKRMYWEELTVSKQFWVQARTEARCRRLRISQRREDVGRALL